MKGISSDVFAISICDREADVYDFLYKAVSQDCNFIVRVAQNRRVLEEHRLLKKQIQNQPVVGEIFIDVPKKVKSYYETRKARLTVQYCSVTIMPPEHHLKAKELENIKLNLVLVKEPNAPKGVTPISWLLVTNLQIGSLEDAIEIVDMYRQRWKIERYHFTLKSGCKVEELQLETYDRLKNALAIYSIIAWRLLYLTYEARENPNATCEIVFKKHEWQALYCMVKKTPTPPAVPPTLKEAILLLAKLGGFLARKCDGEPGVMVLWRGMKRLSDISQFWEITKCQ